jgi:type I restriction enzyme S subunit
MGTAFLRLHPENLLDTPLLLPSLEQQRAIADYLDSETERIDALIEKKRRMAGLLEERFTAAIFQAITRGVSGDKPLQTSGLSWVDEIPVDWGTPPVSANFELQLGKMLNAEAAVGIEQHPYLRNVNVQWDSFDYTGLASMHFDASDRKRCDLRSGDLLVCEGGEVGRAAVWTGELKDCYFQKAIHRVRPRGGANSRYLMYCLWAAAKRSVFSVEGNLSTIVHLTGEQLRVHRFPWPSSTEQAKIVSHLDRVSDVTRRAVASLTSQCELLLEHRQALVTAVLTGELDIPGLAA